MPPVFIVVCNNTRTSKILFDYIAGFENDKANLISGALPIFSNNDQWEATLAHFLSIMVRGTHPTRQNKVDRLLAHLEM